MCVFWLQKSLVISARNRWNRNENGKIFLDKSLGISDRNQRNLKIFCFFASRNHWWFLEKIEKFWKNCVFFLQKSLVISARNRWNPNKNKNKYSWRNHWGLLPGNSEIWKSMIQEKLPGEINGVSLQVSSQHFPYDFDTRTNQWRFFNQIQPI